MLEHEEVQYGISREGSMLAQLRDDMAEMKDRLENVLSPEIAGRMKFIQRRLQKLDKKVNRVLEVNERNIIRNL